MAAVSSPAPGSAAPSAADFDAIARRAFATHVTPGLSVAIVRDGKIVFEAGYGYADVSKGLAVTAATPFAVGSLTKQFTAVAVLLLAARGRLHLDDTLATYVPSLPNARTITLRQLLWQTTGLHNYPHPAEHDWPLYGAVDPASIIRILASDPPDFPPGTKWAYSNANYAALARVVEIASGMPYGAFLQKNVFEPLGMRDSGYGFEAQRQLPVARPYTGPAPFSKVSPTLSLDLYYGAGGIVASAHDMGLWLGALLEQRLLAAPGTNDLWSPGRLNDGSPTAYAMGFIPGSLDGHREVWHNGYAPLAGGYCYDAVFPDDRTAIVVLTNEAQENLGSFAEVLAADLFAAMFPSTAQAASGEDVAATTLVKGYFAQLAAGNVDVSALTPGFAARFTPQFQAQLRDGLATLGAPRSWTFLGVTPGATGTKRYEYRLDFPTGAQTFGVWLTADGKIAGSYLKP